jgi:hypothetical protein
METGAQAQPYCAKHPELPASATCVRCGDHVCAECVDRLVETGSVCKPCSARVSSEPRPAGVSRIVGWMLLANAATDVLFLGVLALELALLWSGAFLDEVFAGTAPLLDLADLAKLGLYYGTGIVFFVWMHRSNKFARALGKKLHHGPHGWGWFFAPVFNLIGPYSVVRELYTSVSGERAPAIFPWWWAAWILQIIASQIEGFLARRALETIGEFEVLLYVGLAAGVIRAVAALLAWSVVRAVDRAQARAHLTG